MSAESLCPASPEERRQHAAPVLEVGARPWSLAPLPAKVPSAPSVQLAPPHSEERRQLARRFTFVLSGLPPREDDVQAFLADASGQALDKLLDRLVATATAPQRLTEVWLRATGYADRWPSVDGPATAQSAEAWRYRDWAVSALRGSRDVRSLARLTLAGDGQPPGKLGGVDRRAVMATQWHMTGFPATGDFEQTIVEWSGRQAERTARAFLGIDLTCARCHDHRALPLSSEEAAGLVAIFAHTRAFVPGPDGAPQWHRVATGTEASREKRQRILDAIAVEEGKVEVRRREFALLAAAEFHPQTAEYVRAAWAWHRKPTDSLASLAASRGLLEEPMRKWVETLGLNGDAPTHALAAPWWAAWTAARDAGTPEAVATAARAIQEAHRIDSDSPFFSMSPSMDAFFTRDQQRQVNHATAKVAALRRTLPEDDAIPALGEGSPPGIEPPALLPSLPALLTGGGTPIPISPPGAGRRALATWLEGEGARFFARLAAVRLAQGLGAPFLPEPVDLRLWSNQPPPEAERLDSVAAALLSGGWPAAAKRALMFQAASPSRPLLSMGSSEWRDAVLFVAGTLDPRQGGPPDAAPDSTRRGLYREWAPVPAPPTAEFLEAQASALASLTRRKGGSDPVVQLTWLMHHVFQRSPTPSERETFLSNPAALEGLCAQLLQSEEFRVMP
ncbi:MAG: DUF1549 domain-containing protein [Verrucomicrobiales bacterium]